MQRSNVPKKGGTRVNCKQILRAAGADERTKKSTDLEGITLVKAKRQNGHGIWAAGADGGKKKSFRRGETERYVASGGKPDLKTQVEEFGQRGGHWEPSCVLGQESWGLSGC